MSEACWMDNIFVFSSCHWIDFFAFWYQMRAILTFKANISNKIWFVCQAIPRRIYKISHINFLPFSCHLSPCVVLCYCHNVNFFSSNGSLILMLCLPLDHLDQRWYDWLQKLNGFSFDIYYLLWCLSNKAI